MRSLPSLRMLFPWLLLAGFLALLSFQLGDLSTRALLPPQDFVEYWAAGRLNATGGNPYSGEQLLPLQVEAGWHHDYPVYMYNPPWTLTFVMPFGLLPFAWGQLLWLVMNLGIVAGCADCIWRLYGGPASSRQVSWAIALLFMPAMITLHMGQIPPLVLLGVVGFLYGERRGFDFVAGASLMLTAIKPQLVYLVGVAVLLWVPYAGRWRVWLGGLAALVVTTAIPWLVNPAVIGQYRQGLTDSPPTAWITTTFGSLLRTPFEGDHEWLQFLPSTFGLVWLIWHWLRNRSGWNWMEQLPLVLLVSIVTTFFAWLGDQVVLLPAVICGAVWVGQRADRRLIAVTAAFYVAGNGVIFLMGQTCDQRLFLWVAPTLLASYLALRLRQPQPNRTRTSEEGGRT